MGLGIGDGGARTDTNGRKQTFVRNVRQLLDVVPTSYKDAAEPIGVSYRWLRRMVSSGISRADERNLPSLQALTTYFGIPEVEDLWREDLFCWLLENKQSATFLDNFRAKIRRLYEEESKRLSSVDQKRLMAMQRTVGNARLSQRKDLNTEEKLRALLVTGDHESLRVLIDDAYAREVKHQRAKKSTRAS